MMYSKTKYISQTPTVNHSIYETQNSTTYDLKTKSNCCYHSIKNASPFYMVVGNSYEL